MKEWIIDRDDMNDARSYGVMKREDKSRFSDLLELPWKGNAHDVSCIPGDKHYLADFIFSKGHGHGCYCYRDVPGPTGQPGDERMGVEVHSANLPAQLLGCQAPGYARVPNMQIDGFAPQDGIASSGDATMNWYRENGVENYQALNTPDLVTLFCKEHPEAATIGIQINNPPQALPPIEVNA